MKLKNKDLNDIAQALKLLDGNEKKEYKFSTKTRVNISKKMRIAAEHAEDMQKVQTDLVRDCKVGKSRRNEKGDIVSDDTPEESRIFNEKWRDFLNEECDIEIGKFLLKDLDLDTNIIPNTILAALLPIITEE